MRVLVVSNMYPGPANPDYGAFVREMEAALVRRGVEMDRAVIDSRASGPFATPAKYSRLLAATARRARKCDVIYAHYLVPTGLVAAACGRVARRPWVLTAHGRDVRNLSSATIRSATARALGGASAVIAVSDYLANELRASGLHLPPIEVANMGVDLDRFRICDRQEARRRLGIETDGPLKAEYRRIDLVDTLHQEVWGQGFAPPTFSEEVEVLSQRLVGEKHLALKLKHQGQPVDAIWFGHTEPLPERVVIAFRLDADEWNGVRRVRFLIEGAEV